MASVSIVQRTDVVDLGSTANVPELNVPVLARKARIHSVSLTFTRNDIPQFIEAKAYRYNQRSIAGVDSQDSLARFLPNSTFGIAWADDPSYETGTVAKYVPTPDLTGEPFRSDWGNIIALDEYGKTIIDPFTSSAGDVGSFLCAFYRNLDGNFVTDPETGDLFEVIDIYLVFVNLSSVDVGASYKLALNFTVGINNPQLNAIFGPDCVGVQVVLNASPFRYSGINYLCPTYRESGNRKLNATKRPTYGGLPRFSPDDLFADSPYSLPAISGGLYSKNIKTPYGENIYGAKNVFVDYFACTGGEVLRFLPLSNVTLYITFYNQLGKSTEVQSVIPSGLTTAHEVAIPADACAFSGDIYGLLDATKYPDAFGARACQDLSSSPQHYASDYGEFVPGNYLSTALGPADHP